MLTSLWLELHVVGTSLFTAVLELHVVGTSPTSPGDDYVGVCDFVPLDIDGRKQFLKPKGHEDALCKYNNFSNDQVRARRWARRRRWWR